MKKRHLIWAFLIIAALTCSGNISVHAKKQSKVTMYVITKTSENYNSRRNGQQYFTYRYSYNKNGVITKIITKHRGGGKSITTDRYYYTKGGIMEKCSSTFKDLLDQNGYTLRFRYLHDPKGRIIETGTDDDSTVFKYNKSSQCAKMKMTFAKAVKYSYNKKGLMTKAGTTKLAYDKHHMLRSMKYSNGEKGTFKNIYKNGRLKKVEGASGYTRSHYSYKYKKIRVARKYKPFIKAQQRWILLNTVVDEYPPLEACFR